MYGVADVDRVDDLGTDFPGQLIERVSLGALAP